MPHWRRSLTIGVVVGLLGVALMATPLFPAAEMRIGLHALFHLRGVKAPPPEVAIVAIDNRTGAKLGLNELPRDWPRSIHARLVDELTRRGAAVIVFDIDFRMPRQATADAEFAAAIKRSSRVVLFEHLNGKRQPIEDADGRERGAVWVENLESPLPLFTAGARGLGPFPLPKIDAAVDQFWTFKSSARDIPTMPAVALQLYALSELQPIVELSNARAASRPSTPEEGSDAEQLTQSMLAVRQQLEHQAIDTNKTFSSFANAAATSARQQMRRALLALYAGDNTRYLNFYGPPGTISTVPYHAVIRGGDPNLKESALDFTDKVVFVGYSDLFDPGQPDRFYTVFTRNDGVDLSGVEIAATAFGNLLRNESLKLVSSIDMALMLFSIGLIFGILFYSTPAMKGIPIGIALVIVYVVVAQITFNRLHMWLPLATPVLMQFPLAMVIGLFGQYRLERQRVKNISEAIRLYVPEEVSRELAKIDVNADRVNKVTYSTCLATDMAGFSTIAEAMKPGELAGFLNEYFEALAQALRKFGVNVTEFRADAIMCAWTGDANDASVRRLPILAALEANREIARFNMQRGLSGSLRVGMADGEVFVGHAGGGGHFVYSIVGDCANTASRIEGLNKHLGSQILATSSVTHEQSEFLTRRLGNFRFVGKTEALPISEVIAARGDATAADVERCEYYSAALAAFEHGQWSAALTLFEDLLLRYPTDGPARFLHGRCRTHMAGEDLPDDSSVIVMTVK